MMFIRCNYNIEIHYQILRIRFFFLNRSRIYLRILRKRSSLLCIDYYCLKKNLNEVYIYLYRIICTKL